MVGVRFLLDLYEFQGFWDKLKNNQDWIQIFEEKGYSVLGDSVTHSKRTGEGDLSEGLVGQQAPCGWGITKETWSHLCSEGIWDLDFKALVKVFILLYFIFIIYLIYIYINNKYKYIFVFIIYFILIFSFVNMYNSCTLLSSPRISKF